ncbi:flagellar hook-length control protein FliK [Pseudomonas sp. GD03944]|uniref:flagellar hook-length control protein FliK n=1 Tax=Pseudomonas sp. GD03944 TaxID=2975409 RepID=UPI002449E000|nr:flagellar hook-length control protein FliK [Pseudomonas sp. GD03944]MDH1264446.1 flagellar hook-length control protein FliK [Pseudomonas sp. GD03944]
MHPLLNPGGASGLPTLGDAQALPRPAGFASTTSGQAETLPSIPGFASELDSLDELLDGATVESLDARDATPVELPLQADERNPAAPEPDAEQWLLSMLGQRDAQVQARDGEPLPPAGDAVTAIDEGADAQVLHGPLTLPTGGPVAPAADYDAALRSSGSSVGAVDLDTLPANTAAVFEALAPETLDAETASAIERAVSAPASRTETPTTTGTQPTAHSALPERTLKLQGPEHKWGEQMLHALRENVEMQVQQRMQSATIRLDPPELGSMEIFLSHESGRLSVQISAAQADVARLLQSTSERLRQELVGQNFMQVSVGVSSDGQSGQQHARQERTPRFDEEPGVAANLTAPVQSGATQRRDDVLITV